MKEYVLNNHYDSFNNEFVNLIENGYSISNLVKKYNIPAFYIIDTLIRNNKDNKIMESINEYYTSNKINDNKCLVISDTHIGLKSEIEYIKNMIISVYEYALKNNIKYVIHLGDLLEGKSNNSVESLELFKQIDLFTDIYNSINDIKTFLLFGNHDFNLSIYDINSINFNKHMDLEQTVLHQKNIELIGVQDSYIVFGDSIIKLRHDCELIHRWKTDLSHLFLLRGHSHKFSFDNDSSDICISTLSNIQSYGSQPGFLELINYDDVILFKYHEIEDNKINCDKTDGKRLIKANFRK